MPEPSILIQRPFNNLKIKGFRKVAFVKISNRKVMESRTNFPTTAKQQKAKTSIPEYNCRSTS